MVCGDTEQLQDGAEPWDERSAMKLEAVLHILH